MTNYTKLTLVTAPHLPEDLQPHFRARPRQPRMRYLYILRYFCGLFWLIQLAFPVHGQVPAVTAPPAALRFGSGQAVEVRTENAAGGLQLRVGELRVPLPVRSVSSITAESVRLSTGASVAVVRLSAAQQQAAVLLTKRDGGKLEALWVGRLDFVGDPGERRADVFEVADHDADGHPDIVVGHYDERVRVCGERHTLLAPRAVDPKSLTLRSVLLNRFKQRPEGLQLKAAAVAPGALTPPPLLGALRPASTSSSAPDPAHGKSALTDGDLRTYWQEGRGLGGRFEFATLSWSAPSRPITALAIVPIAEGAASDAHQAQVRVLSLLGPDQERWTIRLPEQPKPGQRFWITPPKPLSWRCLTVAVEELSPDSQPTPQTHASLAEVEAYTDLDSKDGLRGLVRELAQPGAQGDDATALLQQARADVASAILQAWPELPSVGKRRALRVVFPSTERTQPRAEEVLRLALHDAQPDVVEQALKLAMGQASGFGLLAELAHSATKQGDLAAQSIGHSKHAGALRTLLSVLDEPGASERPALRQALAAAYPAAAERGSDALGMWTGPEGAGKPRAARAALALALSSVPTAQPVATQLTHELLDGAQDFSELWRLVQALRNLPSEPRGDGFLEGLAQRGGAWMLRSAALEALAQRGAPSAPSAALRGLDDAYPRVRASAVAVLSQTPGALDRLGKKVRLDKWFMVRRAALDELPDSPAARQWFAAALSDPLATVRASAVRALARVGAAEAWAKVEPSLKNPEEYPEVIAEGVAFARRLCVRAAAPSLREVVARGLKPDAWSQDQELALSALEAISAFGGEDAAWAQARARSALVPKAVQLAAAAATAHAPACGQKGPSL